MRTSCGDFSTPARARVRGRPVHPLGGPDGALYVSDDATGNIYRVAYTGPRIRPRSLTRREHGIFELAGDNLVNADPAQFKMTANGIVLRTTEVDAHHVSFELPPGMTGDVTVTVENERAADTILLHLNRPHTRRH